MRRGRRVPGAVLAALLVVTGPAAGQFRFEDVVGGLRHAEPDVRRASMRLLAEAGFVEGAVPLAALLTDPVDDLQLEAIATETSLLAGGRVPARRISAGQEAFWAGPGLAVHAVPVEVLRGLLAAMHDDGPRVRLEATYAFGALGVPDLDRADAADIKKAFDLLAGQMTDPDPQQRLAAAAVTGRLVHECGAGCRPADPTAFGDIFVSAVNDRDRSVKLNAMWTLGLLRHERAVQALADQLAYHEHGPEAEAALEALARIAHPSSVPLFWSMLAGRDVALRRRAVEGIGRSGDASRAADLQAAVARERDPAVNLAVAFALQRLGESSHLDRLIEGVYRAQTQDQARTYLIELGPVLAPSLPVYLRDPSAEVRAIVADVLGRAGGPDARAALESLVGDPDPAVAAAVARARARLGR